MFGVLHPLFLMRITSTFGYVCFLHLPAHERHKLTAQSVKCAFLGYAIPQKDYVCYDPHARRIRVSQNVIF